MKIIRIIGHPYLMIGLFLIILISGRSIGGVNMLYLLLALPHFGIHAVLAVCGIAITIFAYKRRKIHGKQFVDKTLGVVGIMCLMLSLVSFFYNDKEYYNFGSFSSTAFWITAGLFIISALCCLFVTTTVIPSVNSSGRLKPS